MILQITERVDTLINLQQDSNIGDLTFFLIFLIGVISIFIFLLKSVIKKEKERTNTLYVNSLNCADNFYKEAKYKEAQAKYKEAIRLKPEEKFLKVKLAEIESILIDLAVKEEEQNKYNTAIATADNTLKAKKYNEAKIKYKEAIKLKPEENYPKDKLTVIENILENFAKKEVEDKEIQEKHSAPPEFFKNEPHYAPPISNNKETTTDDIVPPIEDKVKFIGYEPSFSFEQQEPYYYPMVFMPKPNSVIKFPRKGKQGIKGFSEKLFKSYLLEHFKAIFQIYDDRFVLYRSHQNPFEPDFALIDEKNGLNLFIDIEIDEPYDGVTRQPIHYTDDNKQRDTFFKNRGWVVIRFAEYQVVKETLSCCKFIAEVVASVNTNFIIDENLKSVKNLNPIKQWSKEQAKQWSKENYREKYLKIENIGFTKQEIGIVLTNLIETEIGKKIESHVSDKPGDLSEKEALIVSAINYGNYISCKMDDFYTVIKPKYINNNELVGYCYLKNAEIKLPISKIENIIIREKPFLHKFKKEIGVKQIKKFFTKFIGSKNPVRIKYTKSDFGLTTIDIETGELLTSVDDLDSLRTITEFDIVSNKHDAAKIAEFNLNDEDYISGFCHKKNELRIFKYDRINELEVLNV